MAIISWVPWLIDLTMAVALCEGLARHRPAWIKVLALSIGIDVLLLLPFEPAECPAQGAPTFLPSAPFGEPLMGKYLRQVLGDQVPHRFTARHPTSHWTYSLRERKGDGEKRRSQLDKPHHINVTILAIPLIEEKPLYKYFTIVYSNCYSNCTQALRHWFQFTSTHLIMPFSQ